MDTLIKNALVVTMDEENRVIKNAYIGIEGGKIVHLGQEKPPLPAQRDIDAAGKVVLPGLINAHTHLPMTLLRGYADDYNLQTWLNEYIFPAESKMDGRCVYWASLVGVAEAIASGTTSVSDMYDYCDEIAQGVAQAGMKANIARGMTVFKPDFDFKTFPAAIETVQLAEKWNGFDSGRIKTEVSIHAEYTSYPGVWRQLADYAQSSGLGMHVHLSETKSEHDECVARYGITPAQAFAREGVFKVRTQAAHCVHVTDEDMELLRENGVSAVHNPISNLKLSSGVARVPELLRRGVNVALGTDSAASNNSLDLFEEIKCAATLHKTASADPSAVPALEALKLATINGARAQGRENECGMLKTGMDADLIFVDFDKPHLFPCHNVLSNLAYSARGSDVTLTMVRGSILYKNGEFLTIDIERIRREIAEYAMPVMFGNSAQTLI